VLDRVPQQDARRRGGMGVQEPEQPRLLTCADSGPRSSLATCP
jgi:hypothetical protein